MLKPRQEIFQVPSEKNSNYLDAVIKVIVPEKKTHPASHPGVKAYRFRYLKEYASSLHDLSGHHPNQDVFTLMKEHNLLA